LHGDPADVATLLQQSLSLGIVSGRDPAVDGRFDETDRQTLGAVELVVVPDRASGDTRRIDERVQPKAFVSGDRSAARQDEASVDAVVPIGGEGIVRAEKRRHEWAITERMPVSRNHERERTHEMWSDRRESAAFAHEFAYSAEGAVLQRADSSVDSLETIEGCRAGEIAAFDERRAKPSRRQLASGGKTVNPAANHEDVKRFVREAGEVANHRVVHFTSRLFLLLLVFLAHACGSPTAPPPPPGVTVLCPSNVDVQSLNGEPVEISFAPPAGNGGIAPVNTTCTPPPGMFNVGSLTVTCVATDSRGQSASCNFTVAVRPPPRLRFTRFVSFGDSLTAGEVSFGPTLRVYLPGDSYPAVLKRRLTERYIFQSPDVINEGIGGETAADGAKRLRTVIQRDRPEVLLLMEGTNDLLDRPDIGRGADSAMDALRRMVQEAKSLGVQVGLATVPPQRPGGRRDAVAKLIPSFNDRIRTLASDEHVALIDVFNAMKDDLSLIGVDDLHPTIRGYDVMAGVFLDAIKTSFEETSPPTAALRRGP
jgi:lysophospholipase L1-like esterase